MKAVFAHDHRFYPTDQGVLSSTGQFPRAIWQRYLLHFDSLTVIGRRAKSAATNASPSEQFRSDERRVSFTFGPDLASLSSQVRALAGGRSLVRDILSDTQAVIARLPSQLGLMAVSEAKRQGVPYAIEVAGCPWDGLWNYGTWKGKAYAPVMALRVRRAVWSAPYVLYVTREFLQRRYPNRDGVTVACSNVEIPSPSKTVLQNRRSRIEQTQRPLVLGLIGTLETRYKGIQTVLEALSLARRDLPPTQFRILGGGDPEPWRREAAHFGIDDLIRFDATLPAGQAVWSWLDNVDIYLQPSLKEGLPRSLIEAMSRGCPAIASTCGGIPELLGQDCLIQPGDADRLAERLIAVASDRNWLHQQATRNWRESRQYEADNLDARRKDFWSHFAEHAANLAKSQRV